jgi:hypothetical protein
LGTGKLLAGVGNKHLAPSGELLGDGERPRIGPVDSGLVLDASLERVMWQDEKRKSPERGGEWLDLTRPMARLLPRCSGRIGGGFRLVQRLWRRYNGPQAMPP